MLMEGYSTESGQILEICLPSKAQLLRQDYKYRQGWETKLFLQGKCCNESLASFSITSARELYVIRFHVEIFNHNVIKGPCLQFTH